MRILATGVVAVTLGVAIYWTSLLAYADRLYHLGGPAAVAEARRLAPGNALYFQADPRDRPALEHAVTENPRYSQGWIELGLLTEVEGDPQRAERCLLAAAEVDHTYEPRWSLANFYYRRADHEKFWAWARRAAEMTGYDQTPLFRLCWRASQDPAMILARAVPDREESLAQYLNFLLLQNQVEAAQPVGERLLPRSTPGSLPLLLSYCGRLIQAGHMDAAVRCWNTLSKRGLLPYQTLDPRQGRALTNGDFREAPRSVGFDWSVSPAEGISVVRTASPTALRIAFSGRQPEYVYLMAQVMPVEGSRTYQFEYFCRTSGLPSDPGLRWFVTDIATGKELMSAPVRISDGAWSRAVLRFTTPAAGTGARLALEYRRAEGTTRTDGALWLRRLSVSFQ